MKKRFTAVKVKVTYSIRGVKDGKARKRRYDVFKPILAAFHFGVWAFWKQTINTLKKKGITGEKNLHLKALIHFIESLTLCEYSKNWWCGWRLLHSGSQKPQTYFTYPLSKTVALIFFPLIGSHWLYWIQSSTTHCKKTSLLHNKNSPYCNSVRQEERTSVRSSMDGKYVQEFNEQIHIVLN